MIVVASGYFDPLHAGHVEYLVKARALGDKLWVIVNNDEQAKLKKGFVALNQNDRRYIIEQLRCVDRVVISIDQDGSVCETLKMLIDEAPGDVIFTKGGDRHAGEIPEGKLGVKIVDGLGLKRDSSSRINSLSRSIR